MLSTIKSVGIAAAALLLPVALAPSAQAVSQVTGTPKSFTYSNPGDGMVGVIPGPDGQRYAAGTYILNSNNTNVTAYDVSFPTLTEYQASFTPAPWGSASVSDLGKVADIAARHTEIGSPYNDARWEAAAAQVAIWAVANGVDPASSGNAAFTERVNAIIAGASSASEPEFSLKFDATATATEYGTFEVEVTAFDSAGPVPAKAFDLVVGDGDFAAVSDNSGKAVISVARAFAGQTATVSTTVKVPAGLYLASSEGANIVTASAAPVTSSFEITLPTLEESDAAIAAAGGDANDLDLIASAGESDLSVGGAGSEVDLEVTSKDTPVDVQPADPASQAATEIDVTSANSDTGSKDSKDKKGKKGKKQDTSSGKSSDSSSDSTVTSYEDPYEGAPSALPKTGVADSMPLVTLLLGVAALAGTTVLVARKS